jgi:hypothetical protein
MTAALDRLVCDELTPSERSQLLHWLEAEPSRWRTCALRFVEAQVWRSALRSAPMTSTSAPVFSPTKKPRASATWLAVALAVLVAFGGGWSGARWLKLDSSSQRFAATDWPWKSNAAEKEHRQQEDVKASDAMKVLLASFALGGAEASELKVPVRIDESAAPAIVISEYERKKWERQGYRVSNVREYVPGKLPDGKPVMLSVARLRVRRVGVPTI